MSDDPRLQRIEDKIDALQAALGLLAREAAKLESTAAHMSREIEKNGARLTVLDASVVDSRVDVARLHVKQSALSSVVGGLAGWLAGKL